MTTSHTLTLTQSSLVLLRTALQAPGWAKTTQLLFVGGQLLVTVLPEVKEMAKDAGADALKAWAKEEVAPITLTEKQRDGIKTCLKFHIEAGNVSAGRESFALLSQLGLVEE